MYVLSSHGSSRRRDALDFSRDRLCHDRDRRSHDRSSPIHDKIMFSPGVSRRHNDQDQGSFLVGFSRVFLLSSSIVLEGFLLVWLTVKYVTRRRQVTRALVLLVSRLIKILIFSCSVHHRFFSDCSFPERDRSSRAARLSRFVLDRDLLDVFVWLFWTR